MMKGMRMYWTVYFMRTMCFVAALALSACTMEVGEEQSFGPGTEELGDMENVGVAQQELTACYQQYDHGGNLWEQDYEILMGCDCGSGYVRDFYDVWNNSHGDCWAVGWASPDPQDCRVRVHIHDSGGWAWGTCNLQVEKKLAAKSCDGHCGGQAPDGCWCDTACTDLGDCCSDYVRECTADGSCLSNCGEQDLSGCWCDTACTDLGDCCSDYSSICT